MKGVSSVVSVVVKSNWLLSVDSWEFTCLAFLCLVSPPLFLAMQFQSSHENCMCEVAYSFVHMKQIHTGHKNSFGAWHYCDLSTPSSSYRWYHRYH